MTTQTTKSSKAKTAKAKSDELVINDKVITIGKIRVSDMARADRILKKAYGAIDLKSVHSQLDATALITDAIVVLLDGDTVEVDLIALIHNLTGITADEFNQLDTAQLVNLLISVFVENKEFAVLRLPAEIRALLNQIPA